MVAPGKNIKDRRVQRTHHLLREALASLIGEKPYDRIVVKEILDRANVGRSTFYMHFRDKDDLLLSGIHDIIGAVQSPTTPSSRKDYNRTLWFSLPIFEYHYQHRRHAGDRIGVRGQAMLHEHLRKVLATAINDLLRKEHRMVRKSSQIPSDLLSGFVAATFVLVLNWWVDGGMRMRPKQVNDLFRALVSPTLAVLS